MATQDKDLTSEESLRLLTLAVWNASDDNDGDCPPEKVPVFRQLDDLISTTAWGEDARSEFFRRWMISREGHGQDLRWCRQHRATRAPHLAGSRQECKRT